MKKIYLVAVMGGALFAGCALFTGCANNNLIEDSLVEVQQAVTGEPIDFGFGVDNAVKSSVQAQIANHYEFGVYGFRGTDLEPMMKNYVVAWGEHPLYQEFRNGAAETDVPTAWFYDGLTPVRCTKYTVPEVNQSMKYWDKHYDYTYFYFYAPYTSSHYSWDLVNPSQVTYASDSLYFGSLRSFYTTPETDAATEGGYHQIAGADVRAAKDYPDTYNDELINYNEALYAYSNVELKDYGRNVRVDLKHINAKVCIAFYETIRGYKVQLIDMIPEKLEKPGFKTVEKQNGIVLTPATEQQSKAVPQAPKAELPKHYVWSDLTVAGVSAENPEILLAGSPQPENLYFMENDETVLGTDAAGKVLSKTCYYALPNWDGENYLKGTADEAALNGYTLHVSYKLIPEDGSGVCYNVYDARVWVPADKCRWQAGKAYTYVFKITDASTGSTDPYREDPDPDKDDELWTDPDDPRVDADPALVPIVFDGVQITDYEADLLKDLVFSE